MLRTWQQQCSEAAVAKYQTGSPHFLCLASPGAGKTVMAAEVARRMMELGLVDLILCFAPSSAVVSSIESTFSHILKSNFYGGLGAVGAAYTYHSLKHFDKSFWESLQRHRILVVLDEIHHCSGNSAENANSWGEEILTQIQHYANYTLALSGTPWRTDNMPIVLANYTLPSGEVSCDYVYGLRDAIIDNVCRKPKVVLINSDSLIYSNSGKQKKFSSISDVLNENIVSYRSLVWHPDAMKYILNAGCEKLAQIREINPDAGGLIVASSVEHAYKLLNILEKDFGKIATIVTHHDKEALSKIAHFRHGTTEWILSVGMVSEGTDIPRLQVCCHLSTIKTELHFRQILGRILRVRKKGNQEAWLYTLATDELTLYSERLVSEIPNGYQVVYGRSKEYSFAIDCTSSTSNGIQQKRERQLSEPTELKINIFEENTSNPLTSQNMHQLKVGAMYQRVIDAFLFLDT
ncbi:DEAD/DEAH box helicase [Enterobacter wuhouensis]|uniref:DEAD/DEAH box helicase n=1 Tax=Enterobacter wuhouensis TaxID=2529381 RepID=UPI003D77D4BB